MVTRQSRRCFFMFGLKPPQIQRGRTTTLGSSRSFGALPIEKLAFHLCFAANRRETVHSIFNRLSCDRARSFRSFGILQSLGAILLQLTSFNVETRCIIRYYTQVTFSPLNFMLQRSGRQ